jgi:hypothetical protein
MMQEKSEREENERRKRLGYVSPKGLKAPLGQYAAI